jgi:hypothetical protein
MVITRFVISDWLLVCERNTELNQVSVTYDGSRHAMKVDNLLEEGRGDCRGRV